MRSIVKHPHCPLIQAGARRLGRDQCSAMHFGRHSEHDLSAGGFFHGLAKLCGGLDVIIHRLFKRCAQRLHRVGVKADDCAYPKNAPYKNVVAFIEFNTGRVAFVRHLAHGLISSRSRNSRTP